MTVQSTNLSLLSPSLTVYNASQTQLETASSSAYGATVSATVTGVSAGQVYYVKVAGANTTAFGTGRYALSLNFGSGSSPTASSSDTQTANGESLNGGGGAPNEKLLSLKGLVGVADGIADGILRGVYDTYSTEPHDHDHGGCGCPVCQSGGDETPSVSGLTQGQKGSAAWSDGTSLAGLLGDGEAQTAEGTKAAHSELAPVRTGRRAERETLAVSLGKREAGNDVCWFNAAKDSRTQARDECFAEGLWADPAAGLVVRLV